MCDHTSTVVGLRQLYCLRSTLQARPKIHRSFPAARAAEYREGSPMRLSYRLPAIALLTLFAVAAAPVREYTVTPAAPVPETTAIAPYAALPMPAAAGRPIVNRRDQADRDEALGWLLLLLSETRGAR